MEKFSGLAYDNETRNSILNISTEFFALKGFDAVSMRDIAKAVGIKMSSIYYYYDSKKALLDDVLSHFEEGYRLYFEWLTSVNMEVESLEELMDNLFNKEFLKMVDPQVSFGLSLVIKMQHNNESFRNCVFRIHECSVKHMQSYFDRLIENGVIPVSDTRTIATILMCYIMVGNDISVHEDSVHEDSGAKIPYDREKRYKDLKKFLTSALQQGIPKYV